MSVLHNVTLAPRKAAGKPKARAEADATELLERFGLADKRNEYPDRLSGGQQQRLCIARALAMEPDVLLMDEPASALDPTATSKIEDLLHELKKDYTIVIVTHNMQQAARVSSHTAFFWLGEIVEYASTIDLFERPQNKRTEDYVTGKFG